MELNEALISPKLLNLQENIAGGQLTTQETFWKEIAAHGTPMVETIPGDDRDLLVTFLYRSGKNQTKIGLVSNLTGKMGDYEPMTLLPGTDVWYKTHRLPRDTRETYQLSIDGQNIIDPLNPLKQVFPLDEDTGLGGWESSVFELPDASPQIWSMPRPGVPAGQVDKHYLQSEVHGNRYPVWIYTPPGYSTESGPYGFLLILDGWFYVNLVPAPTILDNLQA